MEPDSDTGAFGRVLRNLRRTARLSQEELAERARISVESVSALERGRRNAPYRDTIARLSDALGLNDAQRDALIVAAKRGRSPMLRTERFDSGVPRATDSGAPKHNLARMLSGFYGRTHELADLTATIDDHHLVTLVGAGGIGKTRVAVELGWTLLDRFRDGVWFVDLAPLTDHSIVVQSFFEALQIPADPGRDLVATLKDHLGGRNTLLIVDNCEHVVTQAATLLEQLLAACEPLRIVATSREPLRIPAERVYRMPTLEAPRATEQLSAAESLTFSSVALFVDRTKAANAAAVFDDVSALAVATICRRLDGIPLAIELAASRTVAFTPSQILAQLESQFRNLAGGRRTAAPRQQTMFETIRWSYDRLTDAERLLFRRAAVFPSGFTIDGAWAVMADVDEHSISIHDLVSSLIDKSLLVREMHGTVARYRLLEPMRDFALQALRDTAETDSAQRLFADWCLEFAQIAHDAWATSPTADWFADVEPEMENLRVCLVWALHDRNAVEFGQRLIAASRRIWGRLSPHEGVGWLEAAKRLVGPNTPVSVEAGLALAEAHLRVATQEYALVLGAVQTYELLADHTDAVTLAEARSFAGLAWIRLGRSSQGERLLGESIAVFRVHGAEQLAATGIVDLACAHLTRDDLPRARHLFHEALAIFRKLANKRGIASVAANLAETEYAAGNIDAAIQLGREAIATSSSGREARVFLSNLAAYLVRAGEYGEARERARESLLQAGLAGTGVDMALAIQHLAAVAVLRAAPPDLQASNMARAARLLGFVDDHLATFGVNRLPTESHEYEVVREILRSSFAVQRFAELQAEGGAWTTQDAIAQALLI